MVERPILQLASNGFPALSCIDRYAGHNERTPRIYLLPMKLHLCRIIATQVLASVLILGGESRASDGHARVWAKSFHGALAVGCLTILVQVSRRPVALRICRCALSASQKRFTNDVSRPSLNNTDVGLVASVWIKSVL